MKLSIITPSYNGQEYIKNYLDSLIKNLPSDSEIIIVDNGSADKTKEIISEAFLRIKKYQQIQLIENSFNKGFGAANNQGAKVAKGEYLIFINQDITVEKNSIQQLLDYANAHPEVGIVAPKLINPNGHVQESVTHLPTLWRAFGEFVLNQKHAYTQYVPQTDQPIAVEAVYGAVILIKKELFEEIGGWDKRYFVYYEDLELCRQVAKRGFKVVYLPNVEFKHLLGASQKKVEAMPFGVRTLSWFVPIKKSGSRFYMIQSARIYHGIFLATLIRMMMYFRTKIDRSI